MAPKKPTHKIVKLPITKIFIGSKTRPLKEGVIHNAGGSVSYTVTLPGIGDYEIWLWALPKASFTLKNDTITAWLPPFVETEEKK